MKVKLHTRLGHTAWSSHTVNLARIPLKGELIELGDKHYSVVDIVHIAANGRGVASVEIYATSRQFTLGRTAARRAEKLETE
jgi:hypothetical protein